MSTKSVKPNTADQRITEECALKPVSSSHTRFKMTKSMHDGVEVWCDCCSCEAEPYWVEAMEEYRQPDSRSKS